MVAVALDVTDAASVDAAFSSIAANQGRLDVLVNNAGIEGPPDAAGQVDLAEVQAVLETNLFGAWRLVQAALPLMRRRSDAHIVNISSGMGQLAEMGGRYSAHRISKAGLNALTRVVAAEEPGIRVNSICPGWVRTDMGGPSASRPVAQGADTAVWLASTDPPPTGGFFRDRKPIPW